MRKAFLPVFLVVCAAIAQAPVQLIPVWTGQSYTYAKLGTGLTLTNGALNVSQPTFTPRHYGVVLAYNNLNAGWDVPTGAANVAVFVNGLRYTQGIDYVISPSGTIKPMDTSAGSNLQSNFLVVADYDQ